MSLLRQKKLDSDPSVMYPQNDYEYPPLSFPPMSLQPHLSLGPPTFAKKIYTFKHNGQGSPLHPGYATMASRMTAADE